MSVKSRPTSTRAYRVGLLVLLLVVGSGFSGDHDVCHHFGVKGHPEVKF